MSRLLQWFQANKEAGTTAENQYHTIRERLLTAVLIVISILGGAAYIVYIQAVLNTGKWNWIAPYTLGLLWIVAITFVRKIPYHIRAYSLLLGLYAIGIMAALQYGAAGDARTWFFGAALLASVFLGLWEGMGILALTTVTYLGIGWMMSQGTVVAPDPGDLLQFDNFASWTTTSAPYFAIGTTVVLSIGVLVSGLKTNIQQTNNYLEAIAQDQAMLRQQSADLKQREIQIRTAAEISRTAVSELDPNVFFQRVVDLMRNRFELYYVGVFTLDDSGHYAILRAGTGDAGRQMMANDYRIAIGSTSTAGYAIINKKAHIATEDEIQNPQHANPYLPETRSELVLPMISGERALGAISVQSTQPNAFTPNDIPIFQSIADSLAIALENANLFQQLQKSLQELQQVHRQYVRQSWKEVAKWEDSISYTYDRASGDEHTHPENQEKPQPTTIKIPLVLRDEPIGYLSLESERPRLTPQEMNFVESIVQQTALALENIRLVEETQRSAQQARIISKFSEEISRSMDVERVLKTAVRELGHLTSVSEATVHIIPALPDEPEQNQQT